MNTKRTLVSFLLIASVLLLTSVVSAYAPADVNEIKVNGDVVTTAYPSVVTAGDTLTVQVKFTATSDDNIKVKATLEGENDDVTATSSAFDVENASMYTKTLTLKVPSDFDSEKVSGNFNLVLEIDDDEVATIALTAQRTSYDTSIRTDVASTAEAGKTLPVEVVVKNIGYNDLEDMYVTVAIAELGVEKKVYIGDLIDVEEYDTTSDEDLENSVRTTLNLELPSDAKAGTYTLTVEASNDDTKNTATKELAITSGISDLALKSGNDLVLLNPTDQLKVYTVKYESTEAVVVMPAESSKTVAIAVPTSGDYKFDVSVMSGNKLLSTVNFEGSNAASVQLTNPVFVLTVILAIVFLVLLVVLVVLITKKPKKTEEFGESYY